MIQIILKPGREKSVRQHHPWIFSGAIARVDGQPLDGDAVSVRDASGTWVAWGTWSGSSQIRVRLWSWSEDEPVTDELIHSRIRQAIAGRAALDANADTTAYRLIFSESDRLPGLIVDRYDEYLVLQLLTVGAAVRSEAIVRSLVEELQPRGIYERSDADVRAREGLERSEGLRWGSMPIARLDVLENGLHFGIDLEAGQKTGAYLDQRVNRARVEAYCAGAEVLSCFSYTGGFELHAARAGAEHITAIDSSTEALAQALENLRRNHCNVPVEQIVGNVFGELRRMRAEERRFDVIILDPPKFAANAAQVERACRGYKDINLLAMGLLRPGGILATFSCSGLVSTDLFQKVVFGASVDAGRDVQILEHLSQGPDHPVLLSFPESSYLKGLLCRVW